MNIVVRKDRCVGHGVCESIAPDVFAVGDDAIAQVAGLIRREQQEAAIAAAASCPSGALRITEED